MKLRDLLQKVSTTEPQDTLPGDPLVDKVMPLLTELRENKSKILIQLKFKNEFNELMEYLTGCDLTPDNIPVLQHLAGAMDAAWEAMDYDKFKTIIEKMMSVLEYPAVEEKPVSRPRWQRPDGSCYACGGRDSWQSV